MNTDQFRVKENVTFRLSQFPTEYTGDYTVKEDAVKDLKIRIKQLRKLQNVLYAHNRFSLLLIFQAMDAAGKDGAIKHVMSGLNPQGTQVFSFKKPSDEELDHDYLWRCAKALPERGRIGIFNRSYYEDVLIVRVHPEILAAGNLPEDIRADPNIWNERFDQIRNFEKHLGGNGTHILKFYLNLSKDEQKRRFLARINTPEKNWKFSSSDARERGYWDDYMGAYEEALQNTSTEQAPWYVLPADHKWFTRLAVSEIVLRRLQSMDLSYPEVTDKHRESLTAARKMLERE